MFHFITRGKIVKQAARENCPAVANNSLAFVHIKIETKSEHLER